MNKKVIIRVSLLLTVWIAVAIWSGLYSWEEKNTVRFDFFIGGSGVVSTLQQETFSGSPSNVLPNDRIVSVDGVPFEFKKIKAWLKSQLVPGIGRTGNQVVRLGVQRNGTVHQVQSSLKRYTKNTFLLLFYLPVFLSVLFLSFSIAIPLQRFAIRKAKEGVEVFSALCFGVSLFYLLFLPSVSLGLPFSLSAVVPLLGVILIHLSLVYPKEKLNPWTRRTFLAFSYAGALVMGFVRFKDWQEKQFPWLHSLDIPIVGACFLVALGALGNTLLTSKDFWARRRARLLSLVFLTGFIAVIGAFVAFVWEVPRISFERILAVSLLFPTAFAVIFLKSNVFDLERMFRRSLHQLLLLGIAATFALLIGVSWSQWRQTPGNDWTLWVAIGIVVVVLARPIGNSFEGWVHRLIQTRVKYPPVETMFESSPNIEVFLSLLCQHFEQFLNLKNVTVSLVQDPTLAWDPSNEQRWKFQGGSLRRVLEDTTRPHHVSVLSRGEKVFGEIAFDGGDAIAFDPETSKDWADTVRAIARCLELLSLREFVSVQQGFLAVGRMQSLLAHEMKNPLAIIQVCSGLLRQTFQMRNEEEAEELIRTIETEVRRVAAALQTVFEHSGRGQEKQKVNLSTALHQLKEVALSRFPGRFLEILYFKDGEVQTRMPDEGVWVWVEKEGIQQALTNLVINAFEASSPSVVVEVHFSKANFKIVVRDTGSGVTDPSALFRPFVTTKPTGTGLGLTHVKSFVDRHQGHIRVKSNPSEGTSFTLEFPRQFFSDQTQ